MIKTIWVISFTSILLTLLGNHISFHFLALCYIREMSFSWGKFFIWVYLVLYLGFLGLYWELLKTRMNMSEHSVISTPLEDVCCLKIRLEWTWMNMAKVRNSYLEDPRHVLSCHNFHSECWKYRKRYIIFKRLMPNIQLIYIMYLIWCWYVGQDIFRR